MFSIGTHRTLALQSSAHMWWPVGVVHTEDDVIVDGRSLIHAARVRPTPLVYIGEAEIVWPALSPSPRRFLTVVLTRVEKLETTARFPQIWVDAELHRCRPIFSAVRLVGREGAQRRRRMSLRPAATSDGWVRLPADLVVGDLIAVPCEGTVPLSDVRRGGSDRIFSDR